MRLFLAPLLKASAASLPLQVAFTLEGAEGETSAPKNTLA